MRVGKESTVMVITLRGGNIFKRSIIHESKDLDGFGIRVGVRMWWRGVAKRRELQIRITIAGAEWNAEVIGPGGCGIGGKL